MDISYEYLYDLCSDDNRCADGSIGRHYFMPCAASHEFYEVWRYTGKIIYRHCISRNSHIHI